MKMTPKFAVLGTFIGCFICALVVLSVWLAGGANQGAQAQGGGGGDPNVVGIDAIPDASNTKTALGTIDRCVQVAGVGSTFDIDVFLDDLPCVDVLDPIGVCDAGSYHNLGAVEYNLNYDPAKLRVNATTHNWLITALAGSVLGDYGDCSSMGSACPDTDGQLYVSYLDTKSAFSEGPGSLGVLDRHSMGVVGGAGTLVYLTLTDLGFAGYEPSPTPWSAEIEPDLAARESGTQCDNAVDDDSDGLINDGCPAVGVAELGAQCANNTDDGEDTPADGKVNDGCPAKPQVWDGVYPSIAAPEYGIIAIAPATCPAGPATANVGVSQTLVDMEPDNPATGTCGGTPPPDIDVSEDEWICLQKTLTNVSGDTPVDVDVTKTGTAPVSPAGSEVSYHCDGNEDSVTVNGTPQTIPCTTGTVHRGQTIVVKHLGISLAQGNPIPLVEPWDVHCTNPSAHTFTFTNAISLSNPQGIDPTPGNNTAVNTYQVNCWAEADVQITSWAVTAPPSQIRPGQDVDITVHKVMYNNGPYGPVNVNITKGAVAPPHCTAVPKSGPTTAALPYHVSVPVDEVWTINCDRDLDDVTFTFNDAIAINTVTTPHVTDPDITPGSNQASTPLMLDVKSVLGDVNCSGAWDVVDAGFIFQYVLGLRAPGNVCPLEPANTLYMPAADVNGDTVVNIVDAGFLFQCVLGDIHNVFCPAP